MNTQWINCQNNNQLIIFFNGWGMSDSVLLEMDHSGFDVLMVNDYRSLGLEMPDISGYEKKYLIAWSMGVWASGVCSIDVDKSIAINGTPAPVNNQSGIDPVPVGVVQYRPESGCDLEDRCRCSSGRLPEGL